MRFLPPTERDSLRVAVLALAVGLAGQICSEMTLAAPPTSTRQPVIAMRQIGPDLESPIPTPTPIEVEEIPNQERKPNRKPKPTGDEDSAASPEQPSNPATQNPNPNKKRKNCRNYFI